MLPETLLRRLTAVLLGLHAILASSPSMGAQGASGEVLQVRVVAPLQAVEGGTQLPIGIVLQLRDGWHVWPSRESLAGLPEAARFDGAIPTEIHFSGLPEGTRTGPIQWPPVETAKADLGEGPQDFPVYAGRAIAFVPVTLPDPLPPSAADGIRVTATISYQACNEETCLPPAEVAASLSLPVGTASPPSADEALFASFDPSGFAAAGGDGSSGGRTGTEPLPFEFFGAHFSVGTTGMSFVLLLLVAAFGGFLLNLTPCVLPVIPLKVMGLAATASNRAHAIFLAAVMSAGVVAFWMVLATGLSFVQGFEQANQLFQYPAFTIAIGVFIAVMAVGMAGFFTLGLPSWIHSIETKNESVGGAFTFGILTAILSTPCTAPFMGSAAGWAVKTESPATIYAVFAAIGVGMASPYLVLSLFPALVARVPRAGEASEVVKQVMGILLLAAAAYFIGAGVNQLLPRPTHAFWWVVAGIGAMAGIWLAKQAMRIARTPRTRFTFVSIGMAIASISIVGGIELGRGDRVAWVPYSHEAAERAAASGHIAVIDFTADWCINCKTLEKVILESELVSEALAAADVVPLKADIGRDEAAKARLKDEGFVTIPLLVVVAPDGEVVMRASDYTAQQVVDAIAKARARARVAVREASRR